MWQGEQRLSEHTFVGIVSCSDALDHILEYCSHYETPYIPYKCWQLILKNYYSTSSRGLARRVHLSATPRRVGQHAEAAHPLLFDNSLLKLCIFDTIPLH